LLIIGTFEHSLELEQALAVLEHSGVPRKQIMVIPMDTAPKPPVHFVNKIRDLYSKAAEIGMACATASSIIGTSVGFILTWGPIFWGMFAALIGFAFGAGLYLLFNWGTYRHLPKKLPEITVIVQCPENLSVLVMETMWQYRVITVGQTPEPTSH